MKCIMGKAGFRAIGAAVFGFAVILLAGATPSAAASYTLNFTGTVTSATALFSALGVTSGDAISGAITYDPFNHSTISPSSPAQSNVFGQTGGSFSFHVSHPGVFDYGHTDLGDGRIEAIDSGIFAAVDLLIASPIDDLRLLFMTDGGIDAPLTSLASLPGDPDALMAFLAGSPVMAVGIYGLAGVGQISFTVALSPVATTPIPAALPLFGTGLLVLGFFARQRRSAGTRAAA